jgi:hypothetical protein
MRSGLRIQFFFGGVYKTAPVMFKHLPTGAWIMLRKPGRLLRKNLSKLIWMAGQNEVKLGQVFIIILEGSYAGSGY